MTSPTSVGSVSIEVLADARNLAKKIRKDVEDALKGLDMGKKVQDSLGRKPVTVQVDPEVDTEQITRKVKGTRAPKIPVELDPLVSAFQQQVRRNVASLSRQVEVNVPVTADGQRLRGELGALLSAVKAQTRIQVPTEPEGKAAYEAKLRAQLAEVAARVKQTVHVDVDVDKGRGGGGTLAGISGFLGGLSKALPNIAGISSAVGGLGEALSRAAGSSAQLGGSLAGAATSATGPIGLVVGALITVAGAAALVGGALVAGFTIAIPAITALAGAIASLPGLLTGIGAGVGTLALGFKGIAEAFKPASGGGGGGAGGQAANQARQIAGASRQIEAARRGIAAANRAYVASLRAAAAAERGVASAQRAYAESLEQVADAQDRAKRSQEAVSRARREAKEDIEDLSRALRGAILSEQEAAFGVEDALLALDQARQTGDLRKIREAQLAYERSKLAVEETADATGDLQEQADKANKDGVEGSDKVQDALRDQAEALEGVEDAQQGVLDAQNGLIDAADALASAQDGVKSALDGQKAAADGLKSAQDSLAAAQQKVAAGGGGVAKQVTKLAPAARAFVNAIKSLKPAFEDLRLDVQQRLFAGLDKTVLNVGKQWIPRLKETLGSYADTFNGFFKNLGSAITTPQFMDDIQAGAEGFRKAFERIGQSITESLIPAFGTLARASAPFVEALGDGIAKVVDKFAEWVEAGDRTDGLEDFFGKAVQALKDIGAIGGTTFRIIGNIFEIITGSSPTSASANPLEQFRKGLERVADYLDDPQNQQKVRDFINSVQEALTKAFAVADKVAGLFDRIRQAFGGESAGLGADIGAGIVTGILAGMAFQAQVLKDALLGYAKGMLESVKDFLGINSPSTVFAEVGKDIIRGLIVGMGSLFGVLVKKAGEIRTNVVKATNGAGTWILQAGKNAVTGLMNGLSQSYGNLRTRAGQAKTTVINALNGAGNWLVAAGRNIITGLGNGAIQLMGNLKSRVASARGYVTNALSNAGNLLVSAGQAIIGGLIRGIQSRLGDLGTFLGDVGRFIQNNKGPIEKDRKLLIPAGKAIMGSLISGMHSERSALADELSDVTALVAGTSMPGLDALGSGMDAAVSRSLSVADRQTLEAYWKPGAVSDPVLDGLRTQIGFRFRGSVEAALGS